ncbi:uncharacterized protein LOC144230101 isoform X3 [Crocuta crocuta]
MYLEAELTLSRIKVGRHFSSQSHTLKLIRYYPVNGTTLTIIGAQNSLPAIQEILEVPQDEENASRWITEFTQGMRMPSTGNDCREESGIL